MRVRAEFPRVVRVLENTWIPARDGTRLAARIWLPEDAEAEPVPAILEAIPYRKSDWSATRDAVRHPWTAGHGYAVVRLDLRGTGDSEGILLDEYLETELEDIEDAIAWLAGQAWCTGAVGMTGISWGGFNGLQVAARRPRALKAIVTLCSTDDRYAEDVHYFGGCVLGIDMLPWASQMLVWNAAPPDPAVVGERWRELWIERVEKTPAYVEEWLRHQRRDEYWKHGSVCEDYSAIECPVLAVGGWVDGYRGAVFRLLEGLSCPRLGIVGPWAHTFPEEGVPGPAIGFLQECLRWWDRWLKSVENGVMDEPMLRAYVQDWLPGEAHHEAVPGRWVAEPSWPSPGIEPRTWSLGERSLEDAREGQGGGERSPASILGALACGLDSGLWCPYGDAADLPTDQRADDGLSLVFDSAPLAERVELLGFAEVQLALEADRPRALVAVRLCDVAPTGASTLVTLGILNLTHRASHEAPEPLEPDRRYDVTVRLKAIGHAFPPGHRIRLAVSPTYWPMAWPSPEPVTLTVLGGTLVLPTRRDVTATDGEVRDTGAQGVRPLVRVPHEVEPFDEPELAPPLAVETLTEGHVRRVIDRDVATGEIVLTYAYGGGRRRIPGGMEIQDDYCEIFRIVEGDPLSARIETEHAVELARGAWTTRVEARSTMTCDDVSFRVVNVVDAFEGETRITSKRTDVAIPRDLV